MAHVKGCVGPLVEFVFVDAPPQCMTKDDKPGFAWFGLHEGRHPLGSAAEWDERWAAVLRLLESAIAKHGPFDGLLGFSNGGACASALLCAVPKGTFRFIVVLDGHPPAGKGDEGQGTMDLLERRRPIETPALFTIGEASQFKGLCEELRAFFAAPETRYHPGGHCVPKDQA